MEARKRYVGAVKMRPVARTPRRLPHVTHQINPTARASRYGNKPGKYEYRAATAGAMLTATVMM